MLKVVFKNLLGSSFFYPLSVFYKFKNLSLQLLFNRFLIFV